MQQNEGVRALAAMRARALRVRWLGALVLAVVLSALAYWGSSGSPKSPRSATIERASNAPLAVGNVPRMQQRDDVRVAELERRVEALATQLAREAALRQRLEQQLAALAPQLAAARPGADRLEKSAVTEKGTQGDKPPPNDASAPNGTDASADATVTSMERALVAAGIDPQTAAEMKRQRDEISLAEIALRDQATREQWVDTPRFRDEMAKLRHEQASIRDEIGDDAYDRYLAALGQPNRVTVSEVLMDSPAAQAGLQAGDVLLRYGDTRLFAPEELVAQTHGGMPGELVPLEVLRQGQLIEIEVRRGPLGLGVAPGHGNPHEG